MFLYTKGYTDHALVRDPILVSILKRADDALNILIFLSQDPGIFQKFPKIYSENLDNLFTLVFRSDLIMDLYYDTSKSDWLFAIAKTLNKQLLLSDLITDKK